VSYQDFFWPPWVEITAGGLGIAITLSGIARAREKGWRGPQDWVTAWGLLVFSLLMVGTGSIGWPKSSFQKV
jgi:hypothetical protein